MAVVTPSFCGLRSYAFAPAAGRGEPPKEGTREKKKQGGGKKEIFFLTAVTGF
jgi:hypothetical protein